MASSGNSSESLQPKKPLHSIKSANKQMIFRHLSERRHSQAHQAQKGNLTLLKSRKGQKERRLKIQLDRLIAMCEFMIPLLYDRD